MSMNVYGFRAEQRRGTSTTSSAFHTSVRMARRGRSTSACSASRPMKSWSNLIRLAQPSSTGERYQAPTWSASKLPAMLNVDA